MPLNDELILSDGVLDFETKSSYTVTVRVTDSGGLTHDESITVNVNDLNDAPTAIAPDFVQRSMRTYGHHHAERASVHLLTATDPDSGETFTLLDPWVAPMRLASVSAVPLSDELILTDGVLDFRDQAQLLPSPFACHR